MHKTVFLASCLLAASTACTETATEPGLELETSSPDRVRGVYRRDDGLALAFDYARSGGAHVVELRGGDGRHLASSLLATDGSETLTALDGRVAIAAGRVDGDAGALAELDEAPELQLLDELRGELAARGIDRDLFEVAPSKKDAPSSVYYDGRYHRLAPDESITFATSGAWFTTRLNLQSFSGRCGFVSLGSAISFELVKVSSANLNPTIVTRQWWGAPVTVKNLNAWISQPYETCGPIDLGVSVQY